MTSDEVYKLIVTPVGFPDAGIPGAQVITASCGHQASVAPSGLALINAGKVIPVCIICVFSDPEMAASFQESFAEHGLGEVPGQRAEVNKVLGVAQTDQVWAQFNVKPVPQLNSEEE